MKLTRGARWNQTGGCIYIEVGYSSGLHQTEKGLDSGYFEVESQQDALIDGIWEERKVKGNSKVFTNVIEKLYITKFF